MHPERFERPTYGTGIRCSIQLSYECTYSLESLAIKKDFFLGTAFVIKPDDSDISERSFVSELDHHALLVESNIQFPHWLR